MKAKATTIVLVISTLASSAQTTYQRNDGSVTVVEQGKTIFGHQTTEVRRYDNQSNYVNGEYSTEIAIATLAIGAAIEAAPYIQKAWTDFKADFKEGYNSANKEVKKEAPWFPLVASVSAGSIAEKAGFKQGDYITSYNGHHLGWATRSNNPLEFKVDQALQDGVKKCRIVVLREDENNYYSDVPGGTKIGVSLIESPIPAKK